MSTTTADTTTDTRRGYTVVLSSDGSPTSGVFDSEAAARAWLDSCPDSWDRSRFEVVECDPLPVGPVVPWASRVLVDQDSVITEGDTYTCEASRVIMRRPDLPRVILEAIYEHRDGAWHLQTGPNVVLSNLPTDVELPNPEGARTLAAALVEAADMLAVIRTGGRQ